MNLTWLNDIHLNFLPKDDVSDFLVKLNNADGEAILIAGDIAEAKSLVNYYLKLIHNHVRKPVYFILGNHDYYGSSVTSVNSEVTKLCKDFKTTQFLDALEQPVDLGNGVGLVGVSNAFGDARYGNFTASLVELNDFTYIEELNHFKDRAEMVSFLRAFSDKLATNLMSSLVRAVKKFKEIIILLHTPPFAEAAWHHDGVSDPDYLPYFSNKVVGEAILETALENKKCNFLVLCGHTHSGGSVKIYDNLEVWTGYSDYRDPKIHDLSF